MPRQRYQQIYDGDWNRVTMRKQRERCCDCGKVHDIDYRMVDGHLEIRTTSNERATKAARRGQETRGGIISLLQQLLNME